jgi:hypothetical protein
LPVRGRISASQVTQPQAPPVHVAIFRQMTSPVRAWPSPPLRGRVISAAGSQPRNPTAGPRFSPAVQAIRIRPSLPPRGSVKSNPGGPVVAPPPGTAPIFRISTPHLRWTAIIQSGRPGGQRQ